MAQRKAPPVADRVPLTLKVYRALTAVSGPIADMVLRRRLERGREIAERLPERRGESSVARPEGPLVWLHGASVGEMLSVLPLISLAAEPRLVRGIRSVAQSDHGERRP